MSYFVFYVDEDHEVEYLTPTLFAPAVSPYPEDTSAVRYLNYAEIDFQEESGRGLINALGNAKRALHLIVDGTLHAYGLLHYNKRTAFPTKLEMLDKAGVLPISILRQLNLERNVMEHEYGVPPRQRVSEAIDVTKLLLLATRQIWENVPYELVVGLHRLGIHCLVRLIPEHGAIRFYRITAPDNYFKVRDGIRYLSRHLRTYRQITPGIEIDPEVFREIELRATNPQDWSFYISTLARLERGVTNGGYDPRIQPHGGFFCFPISISVSDTEAIAITDLFDRIAPGIERSYAQYSNLPGIADNDTHN